MKREFIPTPPPRSAEPLARKLRTHLTETDYCSLEMLAKRAGVDADMFSRYVLRRYIRENLKRHFPETLEEDKALTSSMGDKEAAL